ncbi:hypothetical protein PCANC_00137 [Puccinia coronata f. sp. avenae]|uniref:Glutamine amidotransferase type-2 domain-containing protein n=1 Tax=Puccinia coronata f. sp. avenae TaxID=200324 RepID=A0A2N5W8V2_9BASI|nr:hypothetical protein PCANC_00137 [Puccinia coronata f. sp. avenae]
MLFPSERTANLCQTFLADKAAKRALPLLTTLERQCRLVRFEAAVSCTKPSSPVATRPEPPLRIFLLFVPDQDIFQLARTFWHHTGLRILSRVAERTLRLLDSLSVREVGNGTASSSSHHLADLPSPPNSPAAAPRCYSVKKAAPKLHLPAAPAISTHVETHENKATHVEERYGRNLLIPHVQGAKLALRWRTAGILVENHPSSSHASATPPPASTLLKRSERGEGRLTEEPIGLSHLITKPSHSIINQAFHSWLRLDAGPINADGFGVGWYDTKLENSVPCVFQAITPAWSNRNLFRLAEKIRSPLVFAHVRARTTGALSEENCHPWMYGSLLWMHNGHVLAFSKIKRHLQNKLSEEFFQFPQGSTDSEWAFALFLNELSKVADPKAGSIGYATLKEMMLVTIEKIKCWWVQAGATEPCWMNFAVADGHSVVATKYVTSATEDAASLYFSTGTAFEPYSFPIPQPSSYLDNDHHPRQADQYRMRKFDKREKIVLIASEPLTFEKPPRSGGPVHISSSTAKQKTGRLWSSSGARMRATTYHPSPRSSASSPSTPSSNLPTRSFL